MKGESRYRKLIRDGIVQIAAARGQSLDVEFSSSKSELDLLLARKLVEESTEVYEALLSERRTAIVDEIADLHAVLSRIAERAGITPGEIAAAVRRRASERGGFSRGTVLSQNAPHPVRLHSGGRSRLLDALRRELAGCLSASIAVSFVLESGLDLLEGALRCALLRGVSIRFLTTDYLQVTEPEALQRLIRLPGHIELRAFSHPNRAFHPKAYVFDRGNGEGCAFVGSSNVSRSGLMDGVEWTWSIRATDYGHPMEELLGEFDALFRSEHAHPVTPTWIDAYAASRVLETGRVQEAVPIPGLIEPRPVQALALAELARLREEGEKRALVIAATGLGKTWLAALDSREFQRVLFIAHREELLLQAADAFRAVHRSRSVGLVTGDRYEIDRDLVFATIQTLSRARVLEEAELSRFDYVVIDEFHHAAAPSYTRVIERLAPQFLIGLTATPYRADNRDIYAICEGNVAYEVGLFEAISLGWLCPFRYYGISDVIEYGSDLLNKSRTRYDAVRLSERYRDPRRTTLILSHYRAHPSRAALGFCVSIEHAEAMAKAFQSAGIAALALHSKSNAEDRATAVARLSKGDLAILFTVDLFNEGVDIPCVDLVLFLRPTESMTVFLQQLGRGLRLSEGKERLTVIDLIGNHRNAEFKLPFLVGLEDDDVEAPRRALGELRQMMRGQRPPRLPAGIEIEIEELAVEKLEQVVKAGATQKVLLAEAFRDLRKLMGRRPTLPELDRQGRFCAAHYLRRSTWGSWYGVLRTLDGLTTEEVEVEAECGEFLKEVETTAMTKSFKMVVLRSLLDEGCLTSGMPVREIARYFRTHFSREANRFDVVGTRVEDIAHCAEDILLRYVLENPIHAWVGGNKEEPSRWFAYDSGRGVFLYTGPNPRHGEVFAAALRERVDYQLMRYQQRRQGRTRVAKVIPTETGACIMLGADNGDGLPRNAGWKVVQVGGEFFYAKFAKVAVNVIKRRPVEGREEANILVEVLQKLFADANLLQFRRSYRISIVRCAENDAWTLVPLEEAGSTP
jgi:superfamily II DNA or RNA helicase/HKD family nuclease/predicted house-cleaning noncanonical NTP pyrophosphatase (MazG superfamily)